MRAKGWLGGVALLSVLLGGCTSIKVDHMPSADGLPLMDGAGVVPEVEYRIQPG